MFDTGTRGGKNPGAREQVVLRVGSCRKKAQESAERRRRGVPPVGGSCVALGLMGPAVMSASRVNQDLKKTEEDEDSFIHLALLSEWAQLSSADATRKLGSLEFLFAPDASGGGSRTGKQTRVWLSPG